MIERPHQLASPRLDEHGRGKWMTLAVLMIVGLTNYMDRLSISILQVPIKEELGLSDAQLGAITGLSFSLVYTFAAVPIARMADRLSPKRVIIVCLAAWNFLTLLCGFATGFIMLALLRMGVAIGEAGCAPASHSLLAHQFPPRQRGRAIAIWQTVFPLGTLLGIGVSGMLSATLGWRNTFFLLGGAGLLVVPLVAMFLRDRPREVREKSVVTEGGIRGLKEALKAVLASRSYRFLLLAGFLGAIPLNAALNWNAPFYARAFSLSMGEITMVVAMISGVGGVIGMFGGGFVADALSQRDLRWYCWMPAIAMLCVPALLIYQYCYASGWLLSLVSGLIGAILLNCWIPPQAAIAQSLVAPVNRAMVAACILVTAGLGAAVGPFATGVLSDTLSVTASFQDAGLPWALAIVSLTSLPAAAMFYVAAGSLRREITEFNALAVPTG